MHIQGFFITFLISWQTFNQELSIYYSLNSKKRTGQAHYVWSFKQIF